MNILITGASRGIGLSLAVVFAQRGHRVTGTVRGSGPGSEALARAGVAVETLDVQSDESVAALASRLGDLSLDLLVNNAGVQSRAGFQDVTPADLLRVYDINAIGPIRVTRALMPALLRARGKVFHISSRMGSMGDHPSGAAYAYRMSKAALNMASTNLAGEISRQGVASIVLHPGWVRTDMGGPGATLSVDESVTSLADLMERTGLESTGQFLNYDGRAIPF